MKVNTMRNTKRQTRMNVGGVGHVALAFIAIVLLAGCKKSADPGGHSHDHASESGHSHSGEEGGHDHGEGHDEHADEVTLTGEAIARYGVVVGVARARVLEATFVAPARVGFNTEAMAHVGSPLRGRAIEIAARLGDTVKRGDPLVVVESPELGDAQNEYFQRRVAAQSAVPAVELARVAWERAKGLFEQSQGVSLTEVQKREAEYKAAEAARRAAEAAVVGAENRLHVLGMKQGEVEALSRSGEIVPRFVIVAPIDGQVIEREVTLGELIGPEREAVMVLADTSRLWVLADVPETRLHAVAVGARAWVTIGASAATRVEGNVAFIAPLVDAATRTAQVRIELPSSWNEAIVLRPGMFAQVEVVMWGGASESVVAVPEEAVQTVEGGPAVFVPVEGEANTFAKQAVRIGAVVGGMVPILEGLADGEECVIAGSFILKAELGKGSAAHEH